MPAYALDFSTGPPAATAIAAAGYAGAITYIGFDPTVRPKCVGPAEYAALAGVPVALVYENQAGDMLGGRAAGQVAAGQARYWATKCGHPTSRPIYYACDTDIVSGTARAAALEQAGAAGLAATLPARPLSVTQMGLVLDYLRGTIDVEGTNALVGVYGEYDVIQAVAATGLARWFWQTRAWSRGLTSARAHLVQEIGTYVVNGVDCDRNTINAADWGQAGATGEDTMSQTEADQVIAAVNAARDLLYEIMRGRVPDPDHPGKYVDDQSGAHAYMAVSTANRRLADPATGLPALAAAVRVVQAQQVDLATRVEAVQRALLALQPAAPVAGDITVSGVLHATTAGPADPAPGR